MADNVVLTAEQFDLLLANMRTVLTTPAPTPVPTPAASGTFAECKSRFSGAKGECVEAFINAIEMYKGCLNVSDENALRGLPMLLDGAAATWWQGVKDTFEVWEDAVKAVRHSFGENKPPYKIFRELFSREQSLSEPTDIFVSHARALLAKLPPTPKLDEQHKLDMVYGLLNNNIRKGVHRDVIATFEDLILKARAVEDFMEVKQTNNKDSRNKVRCSFCNYYGHNQGECRKAAKQKSQETSQAPKMSTQTANALICYGCRKPGHIRSQCPNQQQKQKPADTMEVLSADLSGEAYRAFLPVCIAGKEGLAFVDMGARHSMAGNNLFWHLKAIGAPYHSVQQMMTMADGNPVPVRTEVFDVEVTLAKRTFPITLTGVRIT